jgi:hypothetical protein
VLYILSTHVLSPKGKPKFFRYSLETSTFYQSKLAMRNSADMTGGKLIVIQSYTISSRNAVGPLVLDYERVNNKFNCNFRYTKLKIVDSQSSVRHDQTNIYPILILKVYARTI